MKILGFIVLFLSNIAAYSQTINIGVLEFAPPFSSKSGNQDHYYGFTIDLMDHICKQMKADCHYKSTTMSEQLNKLEEGHIDISFLPIPINSVPSKELIYSLPYLASNGQFLALEDSKINSLDEIKHLKIGVMKDTLYTTLMRSNFATNNEIIQYTKITDIISAMVNHEIDLMYTNATVAKYIINNAISTIKTVGEKITLGEGYGIIALPKNAPLIKKINAALLKMETDGSYITIYNRYFTN
jgi:ABC-type amino acid transport substrate-binding protein